MLLQTLKAYNDREASGPPMYQQQAVRYVVRLTADGQHLPPIIDRATKEEKRGPAMLAPHVKRANAIRPKLLVDNAEYTLGIARKGSRPERVPQLHEAFVALVVHCAEQTDEPAVRAIANCLDDLDLDRLDLPDDLDGTANVTFQVAGVFPFELPSVQRFWAHYTGAKSENNADVGTDASANGAKRCIICGRAGPILTRHPLKIRGVPGGQMVKDLISANNAAFESYGLKNSEIAPMCHPCAEGYGNGLNKLLAERATHLRLKEAVYVFWAAEETNFDPLSFLSEPQNRPEQVRSLVDAARTGRSAAVNLDDPTAFYATCLGPSGARVVVREWIEATVGEAQRNLGAWFDLQELIDGDGEPGEPLSIRRLAEATLGPGSDPPQQRVTAGLFRTALAGAPPLADMLAQAVRRVRAEAGTTPRNRRFPVGVERDRAVLIKLVLNGGRKGDTPVSSSLDLSSKHPAYLCGRLLAVIDSIQRRALGRTNATVIDKFYGSASSTPAAVFGTLVHNTQNHLGKLRKDPRSQGASVALERKLAEIMRPLDAFPATLTLPEQGMFALGYYHQRADDERARRERRDAADAEMEELGGESPM